MRFTLEAQISVLQDQIDHAKLDHPEFSEAQLAKFLREKSDSIWYINDILRKSKAIVYDILA